MHFSPLCSLLTYVSQRMRVEAVRILQRAVGLNRHKVMRWLSGVKS